MFSWKCVKKSLLLIMQFLFLRNSVFDFKCGIAYFFPLAAPGRSGIPSSGQNSSLGYSKYQRMGIVIE
jgi:hypothetical protein